jgi:hypothetical protein
MGTIFIKRRRRRKRKSPHIKYIFGHLGFRWSFGIFKVHIPKVPTLMEGSDPNKKKNSKKIANLIKCTYARKPKFPQFFQQKNLLQKLQKFVPKTHVYFLLKLG